MNWKKTLIDFESRKEWDKAVELMKNVISLHLEEDAYLLFNYMLMNVLVEEEYDDRQGKEYAALLLQYFNESRELFSESPSWNFYSGMTASTSEWFMGLSQEEEESLLQKAYQLKPEQLLYQWAHVSESAINFDAFQEDMRLSKMILEDPNTQHELRSKGSLGNYINSLVETGLNILPEIWANKKN